MRFRDDLEYARLKRIHGKSLKAVVDRFCVSPRRIQRPPEHYVRIDIVGVGFDLREGRGDCSLEVSVAVHLQGIRLVHLGGNGLQRDHRNDQRED